MNPLDAIAIAAEVFAWLTLPIGLVLLVAGIARRSWAARYVTTTAVVTAVHAHEVSVRWFGDGGAVYEAVAPLTPPGVVARASEVGDARTVWVHPNRPDVARTDDPAHDGRILSTLGWILTATGTIAVVLSSVLPLL